MIRVLLVDDHALVRQALRRTLSMSDEVVIVGEAADGVEAVSEVARLVPDVVVMDVSMPRKDGLETAIEITELGVPSRVLMLTMYSDVDCAVRSMRAGAAGFLWKRASYDELVEAIREVAAGRRYLPDELREEVDLASKTPTTMSRLSKREFQVLQLLARGMSKHEISRELDIRVKTVDTHRLKLLKKLRLRDNSALTRWAIRNRLIHP